MKRISAFAMALVMVLSLAACGGGKGETAPAEKEPAAQEETAPAGKETASTEGENASAAGENASAVGKTSEPGQNEESGGESAPASKTENLPEGPPTYTFDAATGTLTCSGGGKVVFSGKEGYRDVVANAVFSSIDKEIKAAVEKVVVEYGITSIAAEAFEKCVNLKEVILPDSLVTIRDSAFQSSGVVSIQIPDSVTQIETDAFYYCENLASVKLSSNLESIGMLAFANCTSLTSLELPDSLTTIGNRAFASSGILELTYPKNLTNLDYGTLDSSKVKSVTVSAGAVMKKNIGTCPELTDITFLGDHSVDEVSAVLGELARGAELSKTTLTVHADSGSVAEGWTNKNIADQGWQYVKFAAN